MINAPAGFSQHLRSLREAQGLSVRALADKVGVSSVTIWKWERGDSTPRRHLLLPLARALEINPTDLSITRSVVSGVLAEEHDASRSADGLVGAAGDPAVNNAGEALADVIARAKQMIADASGTGTNNITILIEY